MNWLTRPGRARLVIPLVLVGIAVATMVVGVGTPDRIYFDEVYYVNDARDFLAFGVEDGFVVHPPLGKMLMAVGIWVFGDTPFGWRIVGAVLGVVSVWLTYLVARRLGLRLGAAALAGLVLAWDGIWISQARTGMLDIFLGFFVVLGAYALVRDLDVARARDDRALATARAAATTQQPALPPRRLPLVVAHRLAAPDRDLAGAHPFARAHDDEIRGVVHADLPRLRVRDRGWLVLAGLAFGAATASKWSGAVALVAAGLVWGVAELLRRHRVTGRLHRRLAGAVLVGVMSLGVLPVATYAASWIPWYVAFDNSWIADSHCGEAGDQLDCDGLAGRTRALVSYHDKMLGFHDRLEADHAYRAPAWGWPIQLRPVVYYYETCSQARQDREERTDDDGVVSTPDPCRVEPGQAGEILSLGNPASWWALLAGLPVLGLLVARRDRRILVPLAFYATQFLFWVAVLPLVAWLADGSNVTRPMFNFYLVPVVPFMGLMLAAVVDRITARDAWIRASLLGLAAATVVVVGTWVADLFGPPILEPVRWYVVGITAAIAGAVALRAAPRPPVTGRRPRTWPTVVAAVVVVAMGAWFFPLWSGITLPEAVVKAHWWLPTWI